MELSDGETLALAGGDGSNITNVKRSEAHAVTRGEVHVHLCNGSAPGGIAVFLGTVVGSRAAVVGHPDTIVLDQGWLLLKDLQGN